jgi:uncharacterized protein (DUF952 family)
MRAPAEPALRAARPSNAPLCRIYHDKITKIKYLDDNAGSYAAVSGMSPSTSGKRRGERAMIYKILSVADWEAARLAGRFDGSADDRRDGFIHFSDREQVIGTAAKHFAGQSGLMLLTVEPGRLADLRWERSRDDALFPHLYGPLELAAVASAERLPDGSDAADAIAGLLAP